MNDFNQYYLELILQERLNPQLPRHQFIPEPGVSLRQRLSRLLMALALRLDGSSAQPSTSLGGQEVAS